MVGITRGNLLTADAEALVNSVNCVGYMGKGVALQFKKAFPENFAEYQKACRAGRVQPGRMFGFQTGSMLTRSTSSISRPSGIGGKSRGTKTSKPACVPSCPRSSNLESAQSQYLPSAVDWVGWTGNGCGR